MDTLNNVLLYALSFIGVISVIVFVHEFGHYLVARLCGVRVEAFSIGFGPELKGWNDRTGTRWKISAFPLGGYVKMFGDADPSSSPDKGKLDQMLEAERKVAFHYKPLWQKAAIVSAGPGINFLFAILVFIGFFMFFGYPRTPAEVGEVAPDSPAASAGLQVGDLITEIDGQHVRYFGDLQKVVSINPNIPLDVTLLRGDTELHLTITPGLRETEDVFGNKVKVGLLGISSTRVIYEQLGLADASVAAVGDTWRMSLNTLTAMGQMVTGHRGTEDLGGVIRIAKYSGQSAEQGFDTVLWFMAVLSVNLGLINLFPIPLLDGGHLMYYLIEAVRGRPAGEKFQEYGFRVGLTFVVALMLFTTINDIIQLHLF
ncbi:MAG: RIP metalloprotease RseP [Alphaproteobacteria bacterium]|nr:RIP metalloprotease RseP [Alphaproteobacteria bacterium]